jgi:dTDP-4-dehydrorhamnose reductase
VRPGGWRDARLDVTSPSAIRAVFERERPEAVFYCSYDKAQRAVTVDGAFESAIASARMGARFVLISTDLVFDGKAGNYAEAAAAVPLLYYGEMKLEAEVAVWSTAPEAVILRPSLMVGEFGDRLRPAYEDALRHGLAIDSYVDEWRSPVLVDDVAHAAWELACRDVGGIFHVGGPQRLSRYELATQLCAIFGLDQGLLRHARRPEDRPRDTSLVSGRLVRLLGWSPRPIEAAMRPVLAT